MVGAKDPYSRPKERASEHSARPGIVNFPCYDGCPLSIRGCQFVKCVIRSGLSFENLKFQLVVMCKMGPLSRL